MSSLPSPIVRGYLVLADISGYTSFLSQTELDHAQEILSDLLEIILKRFKPVLTIHKIEGDAVFAYTPASHLIRGETLLELIESTYADFRERMKNVGRHTDCTCRACQAIPLLDLKFVVHHGSFVLQNIGGVPELAGPDVNLVHRLLKNHIAENTGWRAYVLFTAAALDCMRISPADLIEGSESYEHLGEVQTHVMDLHPRYDAFLRARRVVVEDGEAVVTFEVDFDVPPPIVWSWLNEPQKRNLYTPNPHSIRFVSVLRPGGRSGIGATTHCVHGATVNMRETVLDWKPFDYFTVRQDSGPLGIIHTTIQLWPMSDGQKTRLHAALNGSIGRLPGFLSRGLIRFAYTRLLNYRGVFLSLRELLAQQPAEPLVEQAADLSLG